jgi:hypothetical protein
MFKLSVAAALLYGASAVNTDAKINTAVTDVEDRNIDYLTAVAQVPLPTDAEQQRTISYWADNEHCVELFETIISLRKEINQDVITL